VNVVDIATYLLKAGIMNPAETAIAWERLSKRPLLGVARFSGCHVTTTALTRSSGGRHAASPNTSPIATRWRNKHLSSTAVAFQNNARTVGRGVLSTVHPEGNIMRTNRTEQTGWYNWTTLFLGDMNTGTWPSRLRESRI
jgi:hypothetical protein